MITGEIHIATTWAASTSYIPFDRTMRNAHDVVYGGTINMGMFATTAYVHGVWENQVFEEGFKSHVGYDGLTSGGIGNNMPNMQVGNAFSPGTIIDVSVRKLKAIRTTPNRSGIQVNRKLVKGNKLIFRYLAQGELVRPR
jgi:hypothetical protein